MKSKDQQYMNQNTPLLENKWWRLFLKAVAIKEMTNATKAKKNGWARQCAHRKYKTEHMKTTLVLTRACLLTFDLWDEYHIAPSGQHEYTFVLSSTHSHLSFIKEKTHGDDEKVMRETTSSDLYIRQTGESRTNVINKEFITNWIFRLW